MLWQHTSNGFAMRIECFGNTHRMVLQHGSNSLATHIEYSCNEHRIILYPKSSNASIVLLHGYRRDLFIKHSQALRTSFA